MTALATADAPVVQGSILRAQWSVDADRFSDRKLRQTLQGFTIGGVTPTPAEFRALCRAARQKHYSVIPICERPDAHGWCRCPEGAHLASVPQPPPARRPIRMQWSVDLDERSDAKLQLEFLPFMTMPDGTHPTPTQFREICAEARKLGYEVLPICDKPDDKGRCRCPEDAHERDGQ